VKKLIAMIIMIGIMSFFSGAAKATVINFDSFTSGSAVPSDYAGLTWGTSIDSTIANQTGYWSVYNNTSYSIPHSSQNYVYNTYGPDNLWFQFSTPVTFDGAWFTEAFGVGEYQATEVRFTDDLGDATGWLDLNNTPQFLAANFIGATTIYVQRQGASGAGSPLVYTMDDITFEANSAPVPEPSTFLLFFAGLQGVGFIGLLRKNTRN